MRKSYAFNLNGLIKKKSSNQTVPRYNTTFLRTSTSSLYKDTTTINNRNNNEYLFSTASSLPTFPYTQSPIKLRATVSSLIKLSNKSNRFYSTTTTSSTKQQQSQDTSSLDLDLNSYHKYADHEIEHFVEKLEGLGQEQDISGFDIESSDGVLTLKLGVLGTYVINKQTPNKQIWWSSPISGPKRFDFNVNAKKWVDNRDGTPIRDLLEKEIKQLCKYDLNL
eukprot:gene3606-4490_t